MKFFNLLFCCFLLSISFSAQSQQDITLEKLWKDYDYIAERIPGFRFMNDGKHYSRLTKNSIQKYDLTTGAFVEDILTGKSLKGKDGFNGEITNYSFNADESAIMIESETESIYRRSSKAFFHIYNRDKETLESIYSEGKVMYATLSPDGKNVAYVWNNDLYYKNLDSDITLPITEDGEFNKVINGSADWVYEEEFAFAKAFHWSPDGKKIAFLKFDESEVQEFTMTNYRDGLYPEYVTFKYPKVGEANADVSVHIYELSKKKSNPIDIGSTDDIYIPRIKWTKDPNQLCIFKMNRHQNELELLLTNKKNNSTKSLLKETNKYYVDITDDLTFLDNKKNFIWSSEKSGFNHLYLYDMKGKEVNAITSGDYDVTSFYGFDKERKRVYYQAANDGALNKRIFSRDMYGKKEVVHAGKSGSNSVQFSSTFDYYVLTHSTINTPPTYQVFNNGNRVVRSIEDNKALKLKQDSTMVSDVEFFSFKTADDVKLNGYMIKPPNFNKMQKYPVFMYLYGGPGSQQVTDGWKGQNYWWFQMLAQSGYIVACVDNRGTGGRGEEFKKMTYLNLGKYETIDQIEAAKYLGGLGYTDESRIGIFGWSYGGYMSTLCLLKGNDVFKAAIAVAPVTSWKWYDTIYTERYMRTLAENEDGYKDNSPVYFADQLKGSYLLVHGMGDDNVHFQHSAEMANALITANKQFDTYYYPNKNHGIYGGLTRLHLYQKMTDFVLNKL